MEEGDNLERWTKAPKEGGLQAWEKRVLVSQWAGAAWDKLCATYDFEASATRMGMLMTADGSDDDKICVQGVAEYSFTDAEGGPEGAESDDEVDEADEADVADGEVNDGEEYDDGLEDSDEEDDTREEISLEEVSLCGGAPAEPPAGFVYAPACPPLDSLDDKAALVDKTVLTRVDGGWFGGSVVKSGVGKKEKKELPKATHMVEFNNKQGVPKSLKVPADMVGKKAAELSTASYGAAKAWLLLEPAPEPPPATAS